MDRSLPSDFEKSNARVDSAGYHSRDADSRSPEAVAPRFGKYNAKFATIASDIAAIAIPLAALGLIAGLFSLNGTRVEPDALGHWRNAIIAFASIFPIAFAAIVGRLCYQIGRYKLEQGTTIGLLEQFNGSRTFGGAVMTQISLGTVNLLGIGLVLLWTFSPLGTQALLRTLETRLEPVVKPVDIIFKETTTTTSFGDRYVTGPGLSGIMVANFFAQLTNKLTVLMTMPDRIHVDTMDPWGNVKIPFLGDGYDNSTIRTPRTDWEEVVWSPSRERYSAMAGVAISPVPVGNTTLSVESGYIELNCYNISTSEFSSTDEKIQFGFSSLYMGGEWATFPDNANSSWQGYPLDRRPEFLDEDDVYDDSNDPAWAFGIDRFVDQTWINQTFLEGTRGLERGEYADDIYLSKSMESPALFVNETGIRAGPTRLFLHGEYDFTNMQPPKGITAYCDVRQKYVESRVNCERRELTEQQNCTVVAQRPSRKPHGPETISHLNFPELLEHVSERLPLATRLGFQDIGLSFLANPSDLSAEVTFALDSSADRLAFSRRLSQIINTYILLGSRDYGANVDESAPYFGNNATSQSENTILVELYYIPTPWIVLALVACVIFLVGGIASIVYTHKSDGPEVLGYASTLVRDSKFMDLPPESSHMSSSDVARMLKEQRVRYGYTEMTRQGQSILGVGPENEVVGIKERKE